MVSLTVEGKRLDPDVISKIFKVIPTNQWRNGDLRSDGVKIQCGKWIYSRKGKYGESLDSVINKLLNKLKIDEGKSNKIKSYGECNLSIFVGHKKDIACYTLEIDSALIKRLASYNFGLDIFTHLI
jgi:hypothetical protein